MRKLTTTLGSTLEVPTLVPWTRKSLEATMMVRIRVRVEWKNFLLKSKFNLATSSCYESPRQSWA